MKNLQNKVILVEGFDGSGKTTIAKWIASNYGYEYLKSPSGSFNSARKYFDKENSSIHERLAFYIGDCIRISNMLETNQNKKYVLDRYFYSTIAYHEAQQKGSTFGLEKYCNQLTRPDLIIFITADYETTKNRIVCRNENVECDNLFLKEDTFTSIYRNYKAIFDVPCIEVSNNGRLEEVFEKLKHYL